MPAAHKLSTQDKDRILRNLPQGTTRVQVVNPKGKTAWRKPADVGPQDQIMFNGAGDPVVMRGSPGRKRKVELEPINDNVAEIVEAKADHMANDELSSAVAANPDADNVLDIVMRELSNEAASLQFERQEAEREGRDTSQYSLRRARILQSVGDMFLKRKEKLDAGMLDIEAPAFEILFSFMLETMRESMVEAGLRPEIIETTFAKLGKRLENGWREEAKARMREGK